MGLVIEDGIPLPANSGRANRTGLRDALRAMQPGQSVFVGRDVLSCATAALARNSVAAATRTVRREKNDGRTFTTRTVEGGWRIWRLT